MKHPENNEWLEKVLNETIGSEKPRTDFENFKQKHPHAVEMLTSRAGAYSASNRPLTIRNIIMKSPVIKFAAAAAIIIAVLIGIGHFGKNGSSIAFADISERFESVPFFNLTIYIGYDTSAQARKIEIWKSDDFRIRAHEENKVIFAEFTGGENKITAFDRATGQPINVDAGSLAKIFLDIFCQKGEFSLDTLIQSFPSHTTGITPVKTIDSAASKETVVFEVKSDTTPEHLSIWALRESKLPVRICFGDPRNHEYGDFFFNYSEKKDDAFFNPEVLTSQ